MNTIQKLIAILSFGLALPAFADDRATFWNVQRRGANQFSNHERPERFQAAKQAGIQFVRLAPNKWLNGRKPSELGDFLLGRPDHYKGVNQNDLDYLVGILDEAQKANVKIMLTMLSLPCGRWNQHNGGKEERKIWQDDSCQDDAANFWKAIATRLKNHPAVVGYNIRNEPSPELVEPKLADWYTGDYEAWYKKLKGTPADLNRFYLKVVSAIREVDSLTPIVLDSGFYATPWAFKILEPIKDAHVLYAFHMYEPYSFTAKTNQGKYTYPGPAPVGEDEHAKIVNWNRGELKKFLEPVVQWQKKNHVPSNRIIAAEFGGYRMNHGVDSYLKDLISIFNEKQWHWAFYSFREDDWDGMDYELGTKKASGKYWEYIERDQIPGPDVYRGSGIFEILREGLKGVIN